MCRHVNCLCTFSTSMLQNLSRYLPSRNSDTRSAVWLNRFYLSTLMLLATVLLGSCSGLKEMGRSYHVNETENKYDNERTFEQRYNTNKSLSFTADGLNIRKVESVSSDRYYLVTYRNSANPNPPSSNPLQVKADGREMSFSFSNSDTEVLSASNIQVRGIYSAQLSKIEMIANASKVVSKISTTDGFYTVEYDQRVLRRMRTFLESH